MVLSMIIIWSKLNFMKNIAIFWMSYIVDKIINNIMGGINFISG